MKLAIMDAIEIPGIRADARIGVTPGERMLPQPVFLDVTLGLDLSAAAESDDIADAVDYEAFARGAMEVANEGERQLIERLAVDVAQFALTEFPVERVTVRVRKPQALQHLGIEHAAVTITRQRADRDGG